MRAPPALCQPWCAALCVSRACQSRAIRQSCKEACLPSCVLKLPNPCLSGCRVALQSITKQVKERWAGGCPQVTAERGQHASGVGVLLPHKVGQKSGSASQQSSNVTSHSSALVFPRCSQHWNKLRIPWLQDHVLSPPIKEFRGGCLHICNCLVC